MAYKKQFMQIRVPEMIKVELKKLAEFRHCSMNMLIFQAIVEKLERERRNFLNNEIPK